MSKLYYSLTKFVHRTRQARSRQNTAVPALTVQICCQPEPLYRRYCQSQSTVLHSDSYNENQLQSLHTQTCCSQNKSLDYSVIITQFNVLPRKRWHRRVHKTYGEKAVTPTVPNYDSRNTVELKRFIWANPVPFHPSCPAKSTCQPWHTYMAWHNWVLHEGQATLS